MPRATYVVLVDGSFDVHAAKTACNLVRYQPDQVVAAIDRSNAGRTVEEVLGFGGAIPVVASLEEALPMRPDRLLIGIATPGGRFPDQWRRLLLQAVEAGLDLVSGLHTFLREDPELAERARLKGVRLVDLRSVPEDLSTPTGIRDELRVPVVLTVGSDCNVGKMTALWELRAQAARRDLRYAVAPTGQTGILLEGRGIAVDRVISDFISGASERLTVECGEGQDLVLVEGQGSLLHPFYSGVTLGLLHGSRPDAMILCHTAGRKTIRHCPDLVVPSMAHLREMYEQAAAWIRPCPVIALALATHALEDDAARHELERIRSETGLPVEDPVRFPNGALLDACEALREGFFS